MTLPAITPEAAAALLREGAALLVDVREADERARLHVAGSAHLPLSRIGQAELALPPGRAVLFHCASGQRAAAHAPALGARAAGCEAFVVAGGVEALRRAGLEVTENRRAPLPLMRQVQIAAGSLALAGAVLGALVHPGFHLLSGAVGAGLAMAGLTGLCPMARALARMPWNRQPA